MPPEMSESDWLHFYWKYRNPPNPDAPSIELTPDECKEMWRLINVEGVSEDLAFAATYGHRVIHVPAYHNLHYELAEHRRKEGTKPSIPDNITLQRYQEQGTPGVIIPQDQRGT